jgi:hypothetical protein
MVPASFSPAPGGAIPSMPSEGMAMPTVSQNIALLPGQHRYPDMPVGVMVAYYKKMYAFALFPLKVTFVAPFHGNKQEQVLVNVVPNFPGCLVIPEYRAFYLTQTNDTTFWVTPLVCAEIHGWLEIWRGEESAQQILVDCKTGRQYYALFFLLLSFLSFVIFCLPLETELVSKFPFLRYIANISGSLKSAGFIACGISLFLSFIFYWKRRPAKTTLEQQIVFQSS